MSEVLYEERGRIAIVTLNRPEVLNAFNRDLRLAFNETIDRAASSADMRAVVLTGAGRGFSAGADLKANAAPSGAQTEALLREEFGPGLRTLAQMPKPVVAAVSGFAAGIGVAYVFACDLVVMGEGAFLQVPFAKIGLVPDGGTCWHLAQLLGHRRAFEIAIGGERIPAARCLEWGLANRIVPDERVLAESCAWAEQLADAAPIALKHTKRLLRSAPERGLEGTFADESSAQMQCVDSADFREGIAAFREKRAPRFSGE